MIKIAIISFKYPPVYSGYGKQLQLVTEDLLKKHRDVKIDLLTAYDESLTKSSNQLKVRSLLHREDDKNSKSIFPFSIEVLKWLIKNKNTYDVIHCIKAGPEAIVCNFAGKLLRKPVIVKVAQDELSDQEINSVKGINRLTRKLRQNLLKNVNYFIAISDEIETNLIKRIGKRTTILRIPNGVDTQNKFTPVSESDKAKLRDSLSISNSDTVLLYTGAVNKRKGVHNLLDALSMYAEKELLRVVICGPVLGDISFEKKMKEINENKSNVIVDYRGKVSNVDEYMKSADIFILPSFSEGLPNVLLEAGASGLPLIATDIGGSRDIVLDEKNGYILNVNSPTEIHDAIASLIRAPEKSKLMGMASRERIVSLFSLHNVSESYYKLYKKLSEQK